MEKNSPPVTYTVTSALTSPKFGKAFAKGCGGKLASNPSMLLAGNVAMFGHPNLMPLLKQAQTEGRNWYYGDKAYFGRDFYYRITKNAYMHTGKGEPDFDRWRTLGIKVQPWRNGNHVLICPQSDAFHTMRGMSQRKWIEAVTNKVRKHTDRPIKYHYKATDQSAEVKFRRSVQDAWAVVVHSSMAGVQAVIHGVPCFATDPDCTAAYFGSTDLSAIETPTRPDDREHMAAVLAANQWTLDEIASGTAWRYIK